MKQMLIYMRLYSTFHFYYFTGPLKKKRKQYLENPCIEIPRSTLHYKKKQNVLSDKSLVCNNESPVEEEKTQSDNKHMESMLTGNEYTPSSFLENDSKEEFEGNFFYLNIMTSVCMNS